MTKSLSDIDLSVVITAHNEGVLLHKTLLSVARALCRVDKARKKYEVIIHVDNGSRETLAYLDRLRRTKVEQDDSDDTFSAIRKVARIFKNNFGDPGESRNFSIKKAKGRYVAVLDGDDLISPDYLVDAVKILEKRKEEKLILHANYCISFWPYRNKFIIQPEVNSVSKMVDATRLAVRNMWGSFAVADRQTFLDHSYIRTGNGIGHEDWMFNVATIGAGFRHEVVPGSLYLYRKKDNSRLNRAVEANLEIDYSDIFDLGRIARADYHFAMPTESKTLSYKIKKGIVEIYVDLRSNRATNAVIRPIAEAAKRTLGRKLVKEPAQLRTEAVYGLLPPDTIEEWKNLALIEPCVYPGAGRLAETAIRQPELDVEVFNAFIDLAKAAGQTADCVFVVPWLVSGGADKLLLNYLYAFQELYPDKRIAVITTLSVDGEWSDKVPENTSLINFGIITQKLKPRDRDILFSRLLLQLQPVAIHNINSQFFYDWGRSHKDLIRDRFRVFCSVFGYASNMRDEREIYLDYSDPLLVGIYDVVDKIFSDNSHSQDRMILRGGFDADKFIVEHQPCTEGNTPILPDTKATEKLEKKDGKKHVLWASRIGAEKNIETVIGVAKELEQQGYSDVVIDVYGRLLREYNERIFSGINNLVYHGAYNGIESVNPAKFNAFLYTSRSDGMPNILLEVARYGIPIVTTGVGGITDFIKDHKTGLVVDDPLDANAFVKALVLVLDDSKLARELSKSALAELRKNFSWRSYINAIQRDFDGILGTKRTENKVEKRRSGSK